MSDGNLKTETSSAELTIKTYQTDLITRLTNPIHKRLVQSYSSSSPVRSMENELGKILLEVLENED